uniref:Uncharacterized protein n=1 Tax=Rhizophora mucronata TaxID=61149 RepID=A0A2P2PPC3_RHIMU
MQVYLKPGIFICIFHVNVHFASNSELTFCSLFTINFQNELD